MHSLHDELRNYMAHLPGIKRDGMALAHEENEHKSRTLLDRALSLKEALDDWYRRLNQIAEPIRLVRSQELHATVDPPWTEFPISYQFADPAIGPLWAEYHACKIILNNFTSRLCHEPQDVKGQNCWHAKEVCKATHNSYISIPGYFGPYHFATALRIAYMFADPETKGWVQRLSSAMAKAMEVMRLPAIQSKGTHPVDS